MTDVPDFEMDETIEGYEADLRELRARLSAAEQELAREVRMHQERVGALKLEVTRRLAAEARAEAVERRNDELVEQLEVATGWCGPTARTVRDDER